jgi:hypothetical protein
MVHMTEGTLKRILALGALTGMRSMAGLATLAVPHGGATRAAMAVAAAGEMVADKTSWIGDRTDPLPLAGRVTIGAGVGALVAHKHDENALLGGMLGAATALVAAHLAFRLRKRLSLSSVASGLLEDSLVLVAASSYPADSPAGARP